MNDELSQPPKDLLIWDSEGLPSSFDGVVVLWKAFNDERLAGSISIPDLIEKNDVALRTHFLSWIFELGEMQVHGKSLIEHLKLRAGLSYWWMTLFVEKSNFAKSPQIEDAIRLIAFTDWAGDHAIGSIKLVSSNKPLSACIKQWCKRLGLPFEWQSLPIHELKLPWTRKIYHYMPFSLRGLVWGVLYVFENWKLRGIGLQEWRLSEGDLTFISYLFNFDGEAAKAGRYESRYWDSLPDELSREGCKTNWLHLYNKYPLFSNVKDVANIIGRFNKAGNGKQLHVVLETFLGIPVILKALWTWIRLIRVGNSLERSIATTMNQCSDLNLWPLFTTDWRQSIAGPVAFRNLLNHALFESAMKELPKQRAAVYLQENQGWEFGFIQAWKVEGHGQLIGCPHSTVRFWDLRYFFDQRSYCQTAYNPLPTPHHIALNGKAATEAYLTGGYPAASLIEVEALRYLHLCNNSSLNKPSTKAERVDAPRLLVLGDYLPKNTAQQMKLLVEALLLLDGCMEIIVKPHPSCPIRPADYPNLNMSITTKSLAILLDECDIAYTSAVTSAAVDAYCAGVPIVSALHYDVLNLSPLRGCEGVLFASNAKELAAILRAWKSLGTKSIIRREFFTVDRKLPRWLKLLTCKSNDL